MLAVIISYFGTDERTINRRLEEHNKQIDWFLDIDKRIRFLILAQEYKRAWFRSESRITYTRLKNHVTPGPARNLILKDFYGSDNRWAIMLDNDTTLYDHMDGKTVFTHMIDHPERWEAVDMWYPLDPAREGFNERYKKSLYKEFFVLERKQVQVKGSMMVIKNNKEPIAFRDQYSEDTEFSIENMYRGRAVYQNTNTVLKEVVSLNYSTLNCEELGMSAGVADASRRKNIVELSKQPIYDRWKEHGIKLVKGNAGNSKFDTREFLARYWKHPKQLLIPKVDKTTIKTQTRLI